MVYRPNSRPERTGPFMPGLIRESDTNTCSADIGPDEDRGHSPIRPLTDDFVMKRAINHWLPPKHPSYDLIDARLQSFKNWPKGKTPSPESLSEAGFFYNGMYILQNFE